MIGQPSAIQQADAGNVRILRNILWKSVRLAEAAVKKRRNVKIMKHLLRKIRIRMTVKSVSEQTENVETAERAAKWKRSVKMLKFLRLRLYR